jgi:hypothetical protein
MQSIESNLNLNHPEPWLILLMFVGFIGYSYYSLIVLLIYTQRKNKFIEEQDTVIESTR